MNKSKKVLLGTGLVLGTLGMNAQQNTVASGGDAIGIGGSVSFSVGQIDYITATGSGGRMTLGLQQPIEIYPVSVNDLKIELHASVFPNPTRDGVTLRIPATMPHSEMGYRVFDLLGNIVLDKKVDGPDTVIDMANLSNATYLLKVYNKENDLTTFKIIKNL
jgi:hypothetical protein